ncbi:uncharacterized protein LOC144762674 [Lissotriton helveticus]
MLWETGSHGGPTTEAMMRQDNRLLLYSGERPPIWTATGVMVHGILQMVTLIHHAAGREMLSVWPFQDRITQGSSSVMFSVVLYNAVGDWQPRWPTTEAMMRQDNRLLLYSGERPPIWTATGVMVHGILQMVTLIHHAAGREMLSVWPFQDRITQGSSSVMFSVVLYNAVGDWQPRWPTTEAMMRQDNRLLLYSGERPPIWTATGVMVHGILQMVTLIHHAAGREMLSVWPFQDRITQGSSSVMFSVVLYNAVGDWQPRWPTTEAMMRQDNRLLLYSGERPPILTATGVMVHGILQMVTLIQHAAGREMLSVWPFQDRITQGSSSVMFSVMLYNAEGDWLPIWPATGVMVHGIIYMVTLIHHAAGREIGGERGR